MKRVRLTIPGVRAAMVAMEASSSCALFIHVAGMAAAAHADAMPATIRASRCTIAARHGMPLALSSTLTDSYRGVLLRRYVGTDELTAANHPNLWSARNTPLYGCMQDK